MYKHIFGPVPSRRLGISLGVDLVPKKVCSLDCVYCEVGKTTKLTLDRAEYVKIDRVKQELEHYFGDNPDPEYITLSGSGEPTLNCYLHDLLCYIREKKPAIPLAVLTNGTLLYDKEVRNALCKADVVMPSLDAASATVFKRINRPAAELDIDCCIQGLVEFRREFHGEIKLEVFILPGYNDSSAELSRLKKAILSIAPDSVQLNTLDRPGVVPDLKGATMSELQRVVDYWDMANVEIINTFKERRKVKSFRNDIETAIVATITRRPCTLDDLSTVLGLHVNEINKYLDVLERDGAIEAVAEERGMFYRLKAE